MGKLIIRIEEMKKNLILEIVEIHIEQLEKENNEIIKLNKRIEELYTILMNGIDSKKQAALIELCDCFTMKNSILYPIIYKKGLKESETVKQNLINFEN